MASEYWELACDANDLLAGTGVPYKTEEALLIISNTDVQIEQCSDEGELTLKQRLHIVLMPHLQYSHLCPSMCHIVH